MTVEEIMATAPDKIKRMGPVLLRKWAEKQFEISQRPEIIARKEREAADAAAAAEIKQDAFVQSFLAYTPAQLDAYIDNNTATLPEVRALLKKMARMLLILARRELRVK